MDYSSVLPVKAVEVLRDGRLVKPIPAISSLNSSKIRWDGIALESFSCVPGCTIAEHEHPTHFLNLLTSEGTHTEFTTSGRSRRAINDAGTIYLLPRGTRDKLTWSSESSRVVLVMEPRFLARAQEETSHLDDVPLQEHWELHDRQIASLMLSLHADLEAGSPAGRLFGETIGLALAVYLARTYSLSVPRVSHPIGGLPAHRLRRVLDYIGANLGADISLTDLAGIAGMSPSHFSALFRYSTGCPPHRYLLQRRLDLAKRLLRCRDLSVLDVALRTGFADQTHLGKALRRETGLAPSDFRED